MKIGRMLALLGAAAWFHRRFGAQAFDKARSLGQSAGLDAPKLGRGTGSHSSAASATGAGRDDRDVATLGALSGPGLAVDHDRMPGVPPPSSVGEFDDLVDTESAESFPASDPPSGW